MNEFYTKPKVNIIIGLALMLFVACERDATNSVYKRDAQMNPDPVVTSIEPAGGALSGIGQITINGSNFSPTSKKNAVYFGSTLATILSATESQLIVKTPRILGDSIEVRVAVVGAVFYSNPIYYIIGEAAEEIGGYGNVNEDLFAIAADTSENVYVAVFATPTYRIDKITPDNLGIALPYGSGGITTRGMKMGPAGYLYLVKQSPNKVLYRIPPGGGFQQAYILFPHSLNDLDFDPVGNVYTAGGDTSMSNLFIAYPDKSIESVADYSGILVRAVRYYDGYVYLAGLRVSDSLVAVYRNEILTAPNDLGPNEMVFDVTAALGEDIEAQSLTFDEDGDMYIGTTALDPILIVHPDGSHEFLYPGILEPQIFDMVWGNDVFLYVTRRASVIAGTEPRAFRINMQKIGAPYYGRQL